MLLRVCFHWEALLLPVHVFSNNFKLADRAKLCQIGVSLSGPREIAGGEDYFTYVYILPVIIAAKMNARVNSDTESCDPRNRRRLLSHFATSAYVVLPDSGQSGTILAPLSHVISSVTNGVFLRIEWGAPRVAMNGKPLRPGKSSKTTLKINLFQRPLPLGSRHDRAHRTS